MTTNGEDLVISLARRLKSNREKLVEDLTRELELLKKSARNPEEPPPNIEPWDMYRLLETLRGRDRGKHNEIVEKGSEELVESVRVGLELRTGDKLSSESVKNFIHRNMTK